MILENFPCVGGISTGINLAEAALPPAEADPPYESATCFAITQHKGRQGKGRAHAAGGGGAVTE